MAQPGGRRPAPGRLALVQAFLNSHYDLAAPGGGERFGEPTALACWLCEHGLTDRPAGLDRGDLTRALDVREGLRALARANNGGALSSAAVDALNEAALGATVQVRLAQQRPSFVPVPGRPLDCALGALLAITAQAMLEGTWDRLKACPGAHCGWVFYDQSRNRSARWCAMTVCGGRVKAQNYYRRRRRAGGAR